MIIYCHASQFYLLFFYPIYLSLYIYIYLLTYLDILVLLGIESKYRKT